MAGGRGLLGARLWMIAQILLSVGLLGTLMVSSLGSEMELADASWLQVSLQLLTVAMFLGALLLWLFAWKFYIRVYRQRSVTRDALYFAILLGLTVLAPLAFMIIEGKDSFFNEAFA
ncbi:hypothetical protein ACFQY0_02360 [Haloferula chungangensis]|uniref:Uncharacterized protein n=1 Tax=Haloferula chungangensis TaxID=1048331 RepID=A0ABW2L0Z3_9BACT